MNIIKQIKYQKLTARIYHDFRNPRRDYTSFGKIIVNNAQYNTHNILTEDGYAQYTFSANDIHILNKHYALYMPLHYDNKDLYVKKEIKRTTQNQIGWYVLTDENLYSYLKYNQISIITDQVFQQLKNKLIHQIELYNAYRNHNLYTYEIIDNENNILMSSGLIIGLQNAINKCSYYL